MIRYNFRPHLVDHTQILILVRPFFNTSDQDYNFVLKKLASFTHARIQDCHRNILLKFTKGYSRDTLEWGRLQVHRKPLGFIGVARMSKDPIQQAKDYDKIEHRFDNLISQYDNYLFDSRCVIIGPEDPKVDIKRKDMFYLPLSNKDISVELFTYICEFVTSVFVILESKRVDKIGENFDRMVLPTAPIEQEQTVTDSDSRFVKRKFLGRNKKILGDLCLLSGLYQEAMMHYNHAIDYLRALNDFLWVGSALEGICAASAAMLLGDGLIKENANSLVIAKSNININVNDEKNNEAKVKNYFVLSNDEMISKYSECLGFYKKYSTGLVELEGHFKFIRVLIQLKKKLETAQVVQSLLVLPISFNDTEKIDFALVLSSIHEQLGLHRKAAFYRRRAALYCTNNNTSKTALAQAFGLLKQVCPVYKLNMETISTSRGLSGGWPSVQLTVLLDMLNISKSLGNKLDTVRLLCFILEKYASQLYKSDHNNLVDLLEEYSDDMESLLNENSTETNIQLIRPLPIIRGFKPKKLAHHLQPLKSKSTETTDPFIFSSLSSKQKKENQDIIWTCGDVSEVIMVVDNPLPAEIKVNNMTLITEGIQFEAHPATLALPAQSGSFPFMLLGTPSQPGNLVIKGYRVEVLGITNTVLLPNPITVEVTPLLPILQLSSTLPHSPSASSLNPEDEHYQTLFTSANLYRGHSCAGKVTLENTGKVPVTKLNLRLKKPQAQEKNVVFDNEFVQSNLPIMPGETLHLDVTIMPDYSWKLYSNQDKVETMLIMTYSCDEGEIDGYTREICWVTYIKVMPSLELSNISVFEIERHPSCFMISFDAINMTSVSMNVVSEVKIEDETIDLSAHTYCLGKRDIELLSKKTTNIEIHFPRISLPGPTNMLQTLEKIYQKFISQAVCLSWRLSDTNYSGITYLHDIKITKDIFPVIKPKHLSINIRVNNEQLKEGENISVDQCQLIYITVRLTNAHELNLEDMTLHINPYQRCYRSPKQMKELYIPSGVLNKGIKKLTPGETFEHSCGLLFLYHGSYVVDISCSMRQRFGSHKLARQRAFAVMDLPMTDQNEREHFPMPYSPNTVNRKLRTHEADFWAQSFCLNVC